MSPYTAFGIIIAVTLCAGFWLNGVASAEVPCAALIACHQTTSSSPTVPFDCLSRAAALSLIEQYAPGNMAPSSNQACPGYWSGYYTPTLLCSEYWTGYYTPQGVCPDSKTSPYASQVNSK